ncbi:hypothetical protein [Microbacterium sp.]|uniref:hypothetical protein n=1 Tax=Microbacterium sp. TaxID=51671 RepID=UPI003A8D0BC2
MDLDQLRKLPASDGWIFMRGRIATEAVNLEAALRGVHAALRGRNDRSALLAAPESWGQLAKKCGELLDAYEPLDAAMRESIRAALDDAVAAWRERNRYAHDLLVARLTTDDDPLDPQPPRAEDERYRLRLAYRANAPEVESVSLDDATALVAGIVAATWRLRAARSFLADGSFASMLRNPVEGDWDGNASWWSTDDSG